MYNTAANLKKTNIKSNNGIKSYQIRFMHAQTCVWCMPKHVRIIILKTEHHNMVTTFIQKLISIRMLTFTSIIYCFNKMRSNISI